MKEYIKHHYVPKWYQYLFIPKDKKVNNFYYLDLKPEETNTTSGHTYQSKELRILGPNKCFCQNNLYTTYFSNLKSSEIEEKFFGEIDRKGKSAIDYFSEYDHTSIDHDAFHSLIEFLSIQKLRTPKGLAQLKIATGQDDNNLLFVMQGLKNVHCANWTESIWCILDASNSQTKFILSDHPVTLYNPSIFPVTDIFSGLGDPSQTLNGTHTLFPLNAKKILVMTNLSWVRNPYSNPKKHRPNSFPFRTAVFNFHQIQIGIMLTNEEVISINYIVKNRAFRYIASVDKDVLYPEINLRDTRWNKLGGPHFLMPDPRSVSFTSGYFFNYGKGKREAYDEYGRPPKKDDSPENLRRHKEYETFHAFQGEYARIFGPTRRGRSFSVGNLEPEVDSEEMHEFHLKSESRFKQKFKSKKHK